MSTHDGLEQFEQDPELAALLADPSLWQEPSDDLGARVRAAVANEVRATTTLAPTVSTTASEVGATPIAPASLPEGQLRYPPVGALSDRQAGSDAPASVTGKSSPDTNLPIAARTTTSTSAVIPLRRRTWQPFVAAAAAVALLFGGFGLGRRSQSRSAFAEFALAGTELAPTAEGSVKITKTESGLRIELDATGLPRRDGKEFYQAWLRGEQGLVPIGTFHTGDDVVLWAGVALEDFPTLTVTQEEVGDQESSGKRVLAGMFVAKE